MSRLSLHAFFIDSIEAPAFPKDFTTESPLAYSRVAPVSSLFAAARIGAFLVLYFEMMNRNIRETAAPVTAISPTLQFTQVSHKRMQIKFR